MTASKRRFELEEGSSSKFWEIALDGASYTVTYGRIGSAGVSNTSSVESAEKAAAEVAKLIREKLRKGYQELGAGPNWRPPAHIGTQEHVERFLNYKVVEFRPDASDEPSEEGRRALPKLRDLDKLVYAVGVTYDDEPEAFLERLDALLADPKIGELRALVISSWFTEYCDAPPTELYQRLIAHGAKLKSLKGLFLADIVQEESEISWIHQGDVAPLLRALPQLEELVIRGGEGLRLVGLAHPNLRALTVQTGGLSREAVRDIVSAELPALRRLTLWLGDDNYGGNSTVEDFAPLLAGERFPNLEHLGLQDSPQADVIAKALSKAPLLARLQGLDLSMGTLSDEGAEALLSSPHVRGLKHLNLRYHYISPELQTKLRELGIELNLADAHEVTPGHDEDDDRYVEVSE